MNDSFTYSKDHYLIVGTSSPLVVYARPNSNILETALGPVSTYRPSVLFPIPRIPRVASCRCPLLSHHLERRRYNLTDVALDSSEQQ